MERPCSGVCCPMNAATCKCTGFEGCPYYTPQYSPAEIAAMLRLLAACLDDLEKYKPEKE